MFDIKRFIREKKTTQVELSKMLGVTQSFISQIQSGVKDLPKDKLKILKKKYGDISGYITNAKTKKIIANTENNVFDWQNVLVSQQITIATLSSHIEKLQKDLDAERGRKKRTSN